MSEKFDPVEMYPWRLKDLPKGDGPTVVSTFSCGGGSTMGYRLAGFKSVGAVDIDPEMMDLYARNLDTPNQLVMGVGDVVKTRPDLVEEWQGIDVLDGSPPCTLFSTARQGRSDDWGKAKQFREGQAVQILDRLFFDYLDLVDAVRPKVFIAENVASMAYGKARGYVKEVIRVAESYGYKTQAFITRAADHGVPQIRSRIFFAGLRADLVPHNRKLPPLPPTGIVTPRQALGNLTCDGSHKHLTGSTLAEWNALLRYGHSNSITKLGYTPYSSGTVMVRPDQPCRGIAAAARAIVWCCPRLATDIERKRLFSFPDDYEAGRLTSYVTGMSVPPLLMRAVAAHVRDHWLS